MVSYIELHSQTFTLNNLQWSSVLSQRPSPSCHNKVYSQPCYRKSFLPYFPSSPSFLIYYHLSLSLSSLPHLHYPPPSSALLSLICIFCSLPTFPRCLRGGGAAAQTLVVVGFQMVWLAEGSELTPQQLILSYLKPQGVWEGTRISGKMRGRGQERDRGLVENCVTAEPVIYCISSSNSLRLFLSKCLHFRVV